jgi:metal-responsive CopG/Arc/MetJ family transcriptional regulator
MKKTPFLVNLRQNQIDQLKSISEQEQKTPSEMIREAIDKYLLEKIK